MRSDNLLILGNYIENRAANRNLAIPENSGYESCYAFCLVLLSVLVGDHPHIILLVSLLTFLDIQFHPGKNVGLGRYHTIFSLIDGLVKFEKFGPDKKKVV